MKNLSAFFLALIVAACQAPPPFPQGTGAVVKLDLINRAACGRLRMYSEGGWTPPQDVIASLEAALVRRLVRELERDAETFEFTPLASSDYYRRYAGATVEGRRIVVICGEARLLYDERGADWRTMTIPYRDGGSWSFGAHYDPEADEITYFEFGFVG
ncbi:MAG: hypothetical protein JNM59_05285 [Hyphomonadaceae bacterium]|nr:hypothetical protein [Hyphomonadaceae bacterium]